MKNKKGDVVSVGGNAAGKKYAFMKKGKKKADPKEMGKKKKSEGQAAYLKRVMG